MGFIFHAVFDAVLFLSGYGLCYFISRREMRNMRNLITIKEMIDKKRIYVPSKNAIKKKRFVRIGALFYEVTK